MMRKGSGFYQPDVSLTVNIKSMLKQRHSWSNELPKSLILTKGNIKARSRMIAQYALAGSYSRGLSLGPRIMHGRKCHGLFHLSLVMEGRYLTTLQVSISVPRQATFGRLRSGSGSPMKRCRRLTWKKKKPGIADEVALG